jgi:hypothetical protein
MTMRTTEADSQSPVLGDERDRVLHEEIGRLPERFRSALVLCYLWWDIGQDGKPGPIQNAWNARLDLYVLDHRGVIRFKHVFQPELFEKAVATLLKEQKDELGRSKK